MIGWDEILEGGLAPSATVQSWRGMDGAIAAATTGHDAIVSPTSHAYFDYEVEAIDSTWDDELESFFVDYDPNDDFMEQLSRHSLFILVCMMDLSDDEYVEKCSDIYCYVSSV